MPKMIWPDSGPEEEKRLGDAANVTRRVIALGVIT
jgi:hypothetical protein